MIDLGERGWESDGSEGGASGREVGIRGEAGAGTVSFPLMLEETLIGEDVGVLGWVGGAGSVRAVFRVGAVGVLGPEPVEDEGHMLAALRGIAVGVAEFRGPGEV